jgi:hypothetical protein
MKVNLHVFLLTIWFGFKCGICLKTSLQCTQQTNNDMDTSDDTNNNIDDDFAAKKLDINCGMDLIFIAWSHYGHETLKSNQTKPEQRYAKALALQISKEPLLIEMNFNFKKLYIFTKRLHRQRRLHIKRM